MGEKKDRDMKLLAELRKSMGAEEKTEEKSYTFRQYTVDGHRFSSLADLKDHDIKVATPEEAMLEGFAKMLSASADPKSSEFTRTVKNIAWLHQSGGDDIKTTPLYKIAKEYSDKTLATRPGSVERDLLLISAVAKIKSAYRALVSGNGENPET